ncbi:MAG: DUF6142 family protein [Eubacteriales bacterium]
MFLKKQRKDNRPKKDEKNRSSTKYGQVRLLPSRRGIYSCLFAIVGFVCEIALIAVAYVSYGEVPAVAGSIGLIAFVVAVIGVIYGIRGFREREKSYRACKIGLVLNGVNIISFILLFIRGMF